MLLLLCYFAQLIIQVAAAVAEFNNSDIYLHKFFTFMLSSLYLFMHKFGMNYFWLSLVLIFYGDKHVDISLRIYIEIYCFAVLFDIFSTIYIYKIHNSFVALNSFHAYFLFTFLSIYFFFSKLVVSLN